MKRSALRAPARLTKPHALLRARSPLLRHVFRRLLTAENRRSPCFHKPACNPSAFCRVVRDALRGKSLPCARAFGSRRTGVAPFDTVFARLLPHRARHARSGSAWLGRASRIAWERWRRDRRFVRPTSATHKILISTTNHPRSVHSEPHFPRDSSAAGSRRQCASAFRRSRARHLLRVRAVRRASGVLALLSQRAIGTSPALACSREPRADRERAA